MCQPVWLTDLPIVDKSECQAAATLYAQLEPRSVGNVEFLKLVFRLWSWPKTYLLSISLVYRDLTDQSARCLTALVNSRLAQMAGWMDCIGQT